MKTQRKSVTPTTRQINVLISYSKYIILSWEWLHFTKIMLYNMKDILKDFDALQSWRYISNILLSYTFKNCTQLMIWIVDFPLYSPKLICIIHFGYPSPSLCKTQNNILRYMYFVGIHTKILKISFLIKLILTNIL